MYGLCYVLCFCKHMLRHYFIAFRNSFYKLPLSPLHVNSFLVISIVLFIPYLS